MRALAVILIFAFGLSACSTNAALRYDDSDRDRTIGGGGDGGGGGSE